MKPLIESATLEAAMRAVDDRGGKVRWTRRQAQAMAAQVYWHMAYQVRGGEHGEILAVGGFVWDPHLQAWEAWFTVWPGAAANMRAVIAAAAILLKQQAEARAEPVFTVIDPDRSKAGARIARLLKFTNQGALDSGRVLWTYEG
jgi:hypothetical protein